jgi:hypothetical protein
VLLAADAFFLLRPVGEARVGGYFGTLGASSTYAYDWWLLLLFLPYAYALRAASRGGAAPGIWVVVAIAVGVTLPLAFAPPQQSHDVYQYLFYGKLQVAYSVDPYLVKPFVFASDPWYRFIGWRGQVSVYGPLWMELMAVIARISGTSIGLGLVWLRLLEVALLAGAVLAIGRTVDGSDSALARAAPLAFATNPLVVFSVGLGGHADVVLAAAFTWAAVFDRRGRRLLASAALAAAVLVKAYAAPFLLVYLVVRWRRDGVRRFLGSAGVGLALAVVAFIPYWKGLETFRGIAQVGARGSSSLAIGVQDLLEWLLPSARSWLAVDATRSLAVVAVVASAVVICASRRVLIDPWRGALVVTAVSFLVSPLFLPWYLIGPLAVAVYSEDAGLRAGYLVASGSATLTAPSVLGRTIVRYLPPVAVYLRGRRREAVIPGRIANPDR